MKDKLGVRVTLSTHDLFFRLKKGANAEESKERILRTLPDLFCAVGQATGVLVVEALKAGGLPPGKDLADFDMRINIGPWLYAGSPMVTGVTVTLPSQRHIQAYWKGVAALEGELRRLFFEVQDSVPIHVR